jgi:three-Cys-motif partner protein
MTIVDPAYFGREQTAVKHRVLERYLTPLPLIVGRTWVKDVTFVDCCSGPWNTTTDDQSDSSFGIAVRQLRQARDTLASEGHSVNFRCLFIEKDPDAYAKLESFCKTVLDIQVQPLPGDFVELIPEILKFVHQRSDSFPFFFIDPKGWSALKIRPLSPLLQHVPGEVLITFMTSHIRRFLEDEGKDFGALLGPRLGKLHDLSGQERDDTAAFAYADQVAVAGNYPYICTTLVLNPQRDQTHYHLIYGTRHPKGVEVFKQAERKASEFMALARADAQQRRRIESTQQTEMFAVPDYGAGDDHHLRACRDRYLQQAHDLVEKQLTVSRHRPIPYEDAWRTACRFPLVWESDLHAWINREWHDKIVVIGMKPNQRVPKCQAGNSLIWTA